MHESFFTFHVPATLNGATLTAAIRGGKPQESWNSIRKIIDSRRVMINGNLCLDSERRIQEGDVIRIASEPLAAPITKKDIKIVYVDDHLVVVDKPAGINTLRPTAEKHLSERRKQLQRTLEEWIAIVLKEHRSNRKEKKKAAEITVRAVHRLDRDTSGLMVFALSVPAEVELIRKFKRHTIDRAYLAIAHGDVAEQTIETRLVRNRGDGLRGSTREPNATAERAVTHIRPLEHLDGYTVIECRLETGRTHQIRIHLSELGHMLCGEKTYTHNVRGPRREDRSGANRQALHAALLGFEHPVTKRPLQFVSPPPHDFQELLAKLRGNAPDSSQSDP